MGDFHCTDLMRHRVGMPFDRMTKLLQEVARRGSEEFRDHSVGTAMADEDRRPGIGWRALGRKAIHQWQVAGQRDDAGQGARMPQANA